jgi:hypothetical protein
MCVAHFLHRLKDVDEELPMELLQTELKPDLPWAVGSPPL